MNSLYLSAFGSLAPTGIRTNNLRLPVYSPEPTKPSQKLPVSLSPNNTNLKGAEKLVRQAYKVSNVMAELDHSQVKLDSGGFVFQNTNRMISAYLEISDSPFAGSEGFEHFEGFSLPSLESNFESSVDACISASAHKLRLDGNTLSSSNKDKALYSLLNHSIEQNLSVGKQTRWLLRSLPVSECLSNSNFTYSQAKALVGNPSFNSSISSKNIWASTKANELLSSNIQNTSGAITNNIANSSSIINFFEDSRSFLNKKAYFTLQPRLNTTSLSPSFQSNSDLYDSSYPVISISEYLLLDMNILLLGNTLSSGILPHSNTPGAAAGGSDLFLTNDYLSYFVASHDSFVISLNTTNSNNTLNLNFFDASSFEACSADIKL